MNARQEPAVAPFRGGGCRSEVATQHTAFGFEAQHCSLDIRSRQTDGLREARDLDGPGMLHPASHQLKHGIVSRRNRPINLGQPGLELRLGEERREGLDLFGCNPEDAAAHPGASGAFISDELAKDFAPRRRHK